jgi:dipeptidase E
VAKKLPQIVALGGGGFSTEMENPLLDDFILRLTKRRRPKVCLVPTASGDAQWYLDQFYKAFPKSRAAASHLQLFKRDRNLDPANHLLAQDVIYVGGGNTANMMLIWRLHGIDRILRRAWKNGIILCGVSAGMNCWFEGCVTDSFGKLAALNDGLGLLPGSSCPHFDGEADRRPAYLKLVASGKLPAGYAADDGAGLHFVGTKLHAAISSRPNARAFQVLRVKREAVEKQIAVRYLR